MDFQEIVSLMSLEKLRTTIKQFLVGREASRLVFLCVLMGVFPFVLCFVVSLTHELKVVVFRFAQRTVQEPS